MRQIFRLILFTSTVLFGFQVTMAASKTKSNRFYFETSYNGAVDIKKGKIKIKYGLLNRNGVRLTEPIYEKVTPFSPNGVALVYANNNYAYIDTLGNVMLIGFEEAGPFDNYGLAAIKQNSKWGLINEKAQIILGTIFDKIEKFQSNGLAIVKYQNKFGLVDTLGNIVLPVIYDKIENFDKSGYAYIKSGDYIGVVDKQGRAIVPPEYKDKKSALAAVSSAKPKFKTLSEVSLAENTRKSLTEEAPVNVKETGNEEEQRLLAEQARKEEQQRLLAEQARKEEEQRLLAEQARKDEQKLLAEQARKEEEQKLLAERARKEEEQRRAEARKRLESTPNLKNYISANLGEWNEYLASQDLSLPSDDEISNYIESVLAEWQIKGEFEPTAKWQERVNEKTRAAKINALADSIFTVNSKKIETVRAEYKKEYEALADQYCAVISEQFASQNLDLKPYDADNETFLISTNDFGDFLLPVPLGEAPDFKQKWDQLKDKATATFVPNGDDVVLKTVTIDKYTFDSDMKATYAQVDVDYNFKPVDLSSLNRHSDQADNLAIIDNNNSGSTRNQNIRTGKIKLSAGTTPDTDVNIPKTGKTQNNTFAVVIANGEYFHASAVKHAENDGRVMTQYLNQALGIPEENIATFINATYGQMASAISMLQDIGDAYKGSDFNIMFYYVGHGLPDDEGKKSYILPVDVDPRHVSICMPLEKIYADLGNLGAKNVTVMVDACFSGSNHGEGMLIPQSMGVVLKSKKAAPVGNMVVMTAAEGNETAYPYEEKGHGLFTYWILKKLQETSGNVSLGELSDYVIENVKKTSVVVNKKPQTPTIATSPQLSGNWRGIQFGH